MPLNAAKLVVLFLEKQAVEVIFGIPGGHTLAINDALVDSSIRFIPTRHEYGATCAASAWARVRGAPGVCLATCGPGATNLATGLGAALRDSIPVVAITVNNTLRDMAWEDAQHADAVSILRPLVKWAHQVRHPDEISASIAEAFRVAMNGRPGPVLIDFARDVLERGEAELAGPAATRLPPPDRPYADPAKVAALLAMIHKSERPVFWAGNGVRLSGASDALQKCASLLGVPMLTTFNGIGTVPSSNPLAFGPRSRVGTKLSNALIKDSDLVVAIGTGLGGVTTSRWTLQLPHLVQIDIEPSRIGRRYPVALGIGADARATLESLLAAGEANVASKRSHHGDWIAHCSRLRDEWKREVAHEEYDALSPMKPQTLIRALAKRGKPNTVWCVDASNCGIWTHLLPMERGMDYMRPVNFSNMGFGLPAGIGAKVAAPDRDVIVLAGDGGIGMTMTELETASRLKLDLLIVVMNDHGYGNIRQEQLHKYGPRFNGVDLGEIDFALVAQGCGGTGTRATELRELEEAFARAAKHKGPFLIDVLVDPAESVWSHPF